MKKIEVFFTLFIVLISGVAGAEEIQPIEKTVLQAFGVKEKYNEVFESTGVVKFVSLMQKDSTEKEVIYQWNDSHTKILSYSMVPKRADIQFTKNDIIKKCGKPERVTPNRLCYGRVVLTFDENNRLEKVTIHFSRDTIQEYH